MMLQSPTVRQTASRTMCVQCDAVQTLEQHLTKSGETGKASDQAKGSYSFQDLLIELLMP